MIFQGGGALGAYECGAFQAIAQRIDKNEDRLIVVAGTSIGAVNASIIASSYQKNCSATAVARNLKKFWTEEMANSTPNLLSQHSHLLLPFADELQRISNVSISMLRGNPHLFRLNPYNVSPLAPSHYDLSPLERTLSKHFDRNTGNEYYKKGNNPRLIVTAVDIQRGEAQAFDSDTNTITTEKIVACCSLPPYMPAQKIDSHYYWDGGLWSNTPLREVLNCLQPLNVSQQQGGREYEIQYEIPHYQIYLINDHPHQGPLPKDVLGVQERLLDIIMADKTGYDKKVSEQLNHYIELTQKLHQHSQDFPAEVRKQIDEEYQEISQKKRAILHIVSLQRTGLPGDRWSATGDFSHSRIEELIAQGEQETQQQLL